MREVYGAGNEPGRDEAILAALTESTTRGVMPAARTQCDWGAVSLHDHTRPIRRRRRPWSSALDMTTEAP